MVASPTEYTAPSSASIRGRQDRTTALRLLIAQSCLYTRAKRWQGIRWVGLLVLGLAAPVVSVLDPPLAVVGGAVAGLWLFLGRTAIASLETARMTEAATLQEQFDQYVFAMPSTVERSAMPSPEDVVKLAGGDERLHDRAAAEHLLGWYAINDAVDGATSVAIAQRSNAAYTDRLIRTTVKIWTIATTAWAAILIAWSVLEGISLQAFLLGVVLPVLPAALDVFEYIVNTRRAARDRADLSRAIEARIHDTTRQIEGQDLLVWQGQMYDLRRTTPLVPDLLYRLTRKRNERAMQVVSEQLGNQEAR